MRLSELTALLEELTQEAGDSDPEVLVATQPNWPLQLQVSCVSYVNEYLDELMELTEQLAEDEDLCASEREDMGARVLELESIPGTVYIATGYHPSSGPYAPRAAWGE